MSKMTIEDVRAALRRNVLDPNAGVAESRVWMDDSVARVPVCADVQVVATTMGGRPVERHVPPGGGRGHVIYLHGGGYCLGSLVTVRPLAARIAAECRAEVIAVDYRLAPEHPCPAAIDDVLAVYDALLASGAAPESVAVAGDSAGGGLTLAVLLAIRESGRARPAAGICLSPWVDLTQPGASIDRNAELDPMVSRAQLDWMAAAYAGGLPLSDPLLSPTHAELTGLPPLLIHIGGAECFLDDVTAFSHRAVLAGADVECVVWPDMIHVWHMFAPLLQPASEALAALGDWLGNHMEFDQSDDR